MPVEIERKFLLKDDSWRLDEAGLPRPGTPIVQGYLASAPNCSIRLRKSAAKAVLTIKGASNDTGMSRSEYQYEIPPADCEAMLKEFAPPLIEKIRYKIAYAGLLWEVDEFKGENSGLVMAEIELEHENQSIALPPWIGTEVTGDARYYNARLVHYPFSQWTTPSGA
ncbi:MAG: CYTH domain-containing protein [Deltaproteobacteria bacterium]|jgi:CYTH domain-containing protein|nr:CYTH domain-containing protein [Deltaproteobacteria bacterium]